VKKIFLLSKENITLSVSEVTHLLGIENYELTGNLLILDTDSKLSLENRLGFTHSIYRFLFKCKKDELKDKINSFDWNKVCKKSFCVRAHDSPFTERELAALVYKKLKDPKVDLKNPKTTIEFFFMDGTVFAGKLISEVDKSYISRRAHLRPSMHPTSMHPALARACINLTGIHKGTLLDPFCGSGGLLIEASIMGLKTIGYDIDKKQIERSQINFLHYKLKNYTLETKDSTKIKLKADAIATDFPYGKNSKSQDLDLLYVSFLENARTITENLVVVMPDFVDYSKLILRSGWKIIFKNEYYVHKSLTRIILKIGHA
jgi:tRNA (guanine10-N2)-dimethyltransferase